MVQADGLTTLKAPRQPEPLIVSLDMSTLNKCCNNVSSFCFLTINCFPIALYKTGMSLPDRHSGTVAAGGGSQAVAL